MLTITFVTRKDIYLKENKDLPREELELYHFLINVDRKQADKIIFYETIQGTKHEKRLK